MPLEEMSKVSTTFYAEYYTTDPHSEESVIVEYYALPRALTDNEIVDRLRVMRLGLKDTRLGTQRTLESTPLKRHAAFVFGYCYARRSTLKIEEGPQLTYSSLITNHWKRR